MKKACSVFLAGVLLLSVLTGIPFAVSAEAEEEYAYTVRDGEATVMEYTGPGGDVVIPAELGGYPVTTIESRAFFTVKA